MLYDSCSIPRTNDRHLDSLQHVVKLVMSALVTRNSAKNMVEDAGAHLKSRTALVMFKFPTLSHTCGECPRKAFCRTLARGVVIVKDSLR